MSKFPHLYVALSGHGFGHLAQVAPVLNEFRRRWPRARLTVQSALPETVLRQFLITPAVIVRASAALRESGVVPTSPAS